MTRMEKYKEYRDKIFYQNMQHIRELNHYNQDIRTLAEIRNLIELPYEYKHASKKQRVQ